MVNTFFKKFYIFVILISFVRELETYFDNATINFATKSSDRFEFTKRYSRRSSRKSQRFFSFEPRDDNLELGIEFAVPFISIPIKPTVDSMRSFSNKLTAPIANINTGAVVLTAIVVSAAIITGYLWKGFNFVFQRPNFSTLQNVTMINGTNTTDASENRTERADNQIWYLMQNLETFLEKYDIDTVSCTQRAICTIIKNAAANVSNGRGSSTDKILDGFTSINWIQNIFQGTPIADALQSARHHRNCEIKYARCKMKNRSVWNTIDRILRTLSS